MDKDTVPESASCCTSHLPAPSNWVVAAALYFKRLDSVYIALERCCLDGSTKGGGRTEWCRDRGRGTSVIGIHYDRTFRKSVMRCWNDRRAKCQA